MKGIFITGAHAAALQQASSTLSASGMQAALPAQRTEPLDLAFWHEQVLAASADDAQAGQPAANPSRLWDQLAGDIWVANIKSGVWGWADTRVTWLLDYWVGFETRLYFILVVNSPPHALASALFGQGAPASADAVMQQWQLHHEALLRFYNRNPKRCLLVDADDCARNPAALVALCNQQWGLGLVPPPAADAVVASQGALAQFLAAQLGHQYPQAASLQHEIQATVTRLGADAGNLAAPNAAGLAPIIEDYRQLLDRSAEQAQLAAQQQENELMLTQLHQVQEALEQNFLKVKALQGQLDAAQQEQKAQQQQAARDRTQQDEAQAAQAQLHQKKLAELAAQHEAAQKQAQAKHEAATKQLQAQHQQQLKEQQQEGELLLQQLHQVQEELEQFFLKAQTLQSQLDAAQLEQKAQQQKTARDRTQQDAAQAAQAQLHQKQLAELAAKHEAALKQLQTQHQQKLKELQQQVQQQQQDGERLKQEAAQARLQQKKLAEQAAQHEAALKQHQQQLKEHQQQLKEQQQENELLLQQLHQVQEELEHYFLQHQDAQRQLAAANQRWQSMLERTPGFCEYESIEVLPSATAGQTHWRIRNFSAAGRSLPVIEFKTLLQDGMAGYLIDNAGADKTDGTAGLLRRWPSAAAGQPSLTVMPAARAAGANLAVLQQIATSDWTLLQTLTSLLGRALATPQMVSAPKGFEPQALQAGLGQLAQALGSYAPTLRFDAVRLKREQVNPDYEHLWLGFDNLSLGGQRWAAFEFRLSCANVRPQHFGTHPKLEFPQANGQTPLEAWFEESHDDFGPKMELRFAMPDAMDVGVWRQLTDADQQFLTALVQMLPAVLRSLQSAGTPLKRPWADWTQLAGEVQRILALRSAALKPPLTRASTPAAPPTVAPDNKSKRSGRKGAAA